MKFEIGDILLNVRLGILFTVTATTGGSALLARTYARALYPSEVIFFEDDSGSEEYRVIGRQSAAE